ncbi:MAG: hypothetical protein WCT51_00020 [Candidatus Shapirobacteria bacterium]|jgi:Tfp pilus assembly protein PilV
MKNNKGQSLVEVIFSMGIVILVLVGVVMLMVVTAKAKRIASERQKAIELSQLLIEDKVNYFKDENNILSFWNAPSHTNITNQSNTDFSGYSYDTTYDNCDNNSCKIIFTITWGDSQRLSVERVFLRKGL